MKKWEDLTKKEQTKFIAYMNTEQMKQSINDHNFISLLLLFIIGLGSAAFFGLAGTMMVSIGMQSDAISITAGLDILQMAFIVGAMILVICAVLAFVFVYLKRKNEKINYLIFGMNKPSYEMFDIDKEDIKKVKEGLVKIKGEENG